MSELRQDPTTGEWVIIATERAKRPADMLRQKVKPELPAFSPSCPFCPGNESLTPGEVLAYRDQNNQKWRLRVIKNQFPALRPEGNTVTKLEHGFFVKMDGIGVHEVIVETPEHNKILPLQTESGFQDILIAYRERYNALIQMSINRLVIIYKNYGPMAGTTLDHSHSQLIASSIIPMQLRTKYEIATSYHNFTGKNLYREIVNCELAIGKRVVMETDAFAAYHPFASHSPFETWIVPKQNQAAYGHISEKHLEELARVLRTILLKHYHGLNNPDFNYVINSAPAGDEDAESYLWHIRIIPRLIEQTGFEIGSGINMNSILPEETAQFMRKLNVE